ncbi:PadR family transcriptional regulator [Actinoplanes sp. DH11]|uniref:PadR family transcriptional regulator n=1 Tax=Actinoplanes sp. DH11 TaxID=2857011 RepID=UPI001E6446EC|nr:helix-turn-helix transcriptional regulator [Actinoplanes sp. DH11]
MTLQVRLVLHALAAEPDRQLYGLEIIDATGLMPGTIYPILARLEQAGWLRSEWEAVDEHAVGRPRRRYYGLTADGATAAVAAKTTAAQRRTSAAVGDILPGGAY